MAMPDDLTPILPPTDEPLTATSKPSSSSVGRRLALVIAGLVLCAGVAVVVHSEGKLFHHTAQRTAPTIPATEETAPQFIRLEAIPTEMEAAAPATDEEEDEGDVRRCQRPPAHPPRMEAHLRQAKTSP